MTVQWDIGQPRVDVGAQFQAGMEHGRVVRQQTDRTNALRGYAANPNDQGAQNALLVADPTLATQLGDQRMQVQQFQHQQALAALAQHRDRINFFGETDGQRPVTDQASWSATLAAGRQAGFDVSDVPPTYDPAYVNGLRQAYTTFQRRQPGYTLDAGATRFRGDGSPEARGAPTPDHVVPLQAGGGYLIQHQNPDGSSSYVGADGAGSAATANLPRPTSPEERARLAPGTRYIAPDNSIRTVPGGAPQPNAASTFPGQGGR